jgi:hypothetical protein
MCRDLIKRIPLRPSFPSKIISKEMGYLSPEIEAWSKKMKNERSSLVKKAHSCGIFQDYGKGQDETGDKQE